MWHSAQGLCYIAPVGCFQYIIVVLYICVPTQAHLPRVLQSLSMGAEHYL
jgi:hypothetical protein